MSKLKVIKIENVKDAIKHSKGTLWHFGCSGKEIHRNNFNDYYYRGSCNIYVVIDKKAEDPARTKMCVVAWPGGWLEVWDSQNHMLNASESVNVIDRAEKEAKIVIPKKSAKRKKA